MYYLGISDAAPRIPNIRMCLHVGKGRRQRRQTNRAKEPKRKPLKMPRSRKRIVIIWAKGMLVFLALTHAGEASLARQVHHGIPSLRDWPCVKGEQFLRHSRGSPVWLSSAELMERAIDRQELERPALLGPSGLHGEVTVQLLIEKDGGVKCVRG